MIRTLDAGGIVNLKSYLIAFSLALVLGARMLSGQFGADDSQAVVSETAEQAPADVEMRLRALGSSMRTIEGMEVLWDSGADQAMKDAVAAAERRSKELAADFDDE